MADGSIKISIEVDGKQVDVAAKQLDNLEASGNKSGKGIKAAEDSLDSLSDKSAKAGTSVKGAGDSIEGLGESGSKAGQGLKGAEGAIDGVADSSAQAASSVKGAGDTIEGLGSSGDSASKGLQGVDGALDGVADSSAQASDSVRNASDAMADVDGKTNQASGSIMSFAASIGLVAIAAKAFDLMTASVDQAVGRFDTLNAFPKVLQALGVSAEDSEAAMAKLSDGIDGLPTKLNDIAANAQRMYTSFGDMDKAADSAIGLNNALLGSGASADQAKRGTEQYIKALQRGSIDLNTWTTLSETMDVGLVKIAEGFGFAGKTAKDDLYKALQDGTITMDEFNDKLIEVGTGTGIMAKLAKENSLGVATSIGNLRNAIANGVAKMIEAFNNLSRAATGKEIAEHIDGLKGIVNTAFNVMKTAVEASTPVFKFFATVVKSVIDVVKPFTPVVMGLVAAFTAMMVLNKVIGLINASNATLSAALLSTKALTLATKGQMAAKIADTTATKANTVAQAANLGMVKVSTLAIGLLTGKIKLLQAAKIAWAAITRGLSTVMTALSGPVGIASLAIGGLVAATIGIVKWFKSSSEESERLKEEVEQMKNETDELTQSVDSNTAAYKDQVSEISANKDAQNELLQTVTDLSEKEKKSAEDKQELKAAVDQLNGSVEGLNLMYNEEADRLSESSDQIKARIDLMSDLESGQAAQERYTEILQDQSKVEEQLNDVLKKKEELMIGGKFATAEAKIESENLTEQEELLRAKLEELGDEKQDTTEKMTAAQDAVKKAVEDGNAAMILSYDVLSEAQQDAFERMKDKYTDLKDAATDAFQKINDESEVSASEMIENLQHNQKMVENWGENHGKLMEYASKNGHDGFMMWLDSLGIDSAAELQTVANMSEEQLEKFAGLMDEGGNKAATAMKDSLGEGLGEVGDILVSMVEDGALTTQEAIEAANFYELFGVLPEEAKAAVEDGTPEVETATSNMVDKAWTGLNIAMGNYDFSEKGEEIPIDMRTGMESGSPYVEAASQTLGRDAVDPMTNEIANSDIEGSGDEISVRLSGSINNGKESVAWSSGEIGKTPGKEISNEIDATPFETIGGSAPTRTGEGIIANKGIATAAANELTDGVKSEFESGFEPSIYVNYGSRTGDNIGGGIDNSSGIATGAAKNLADNVDSEVAGGMTQSKYEGYGNNVGVGLGNGILAMSDFVARSVRSVTSDATAAATGALGIHSPSRVFFGYGQFVSQGLGNGISDGKSGVINSILAMTSSMISNTRTGMNDMQNTTQTGISGMNRRMGRLSVIANSNMRNMQAKLSSGASHSVAIMTGLAVNMIRPFGSIQGRMASIGSFAMSGLNAGLNGGAGRVMSTARSIATRVASTMQRALKIHSPSRVMEDDVGRWVPAGIAVGIEDNAKLVYRAMDDLAAGMIKPVSPEVALGTSAMAYNGSDSISQAVRNIRIPENKPDGSVAGLLRESNDILRSLLNKDSNTYLDSEKITQAVNENNAILASLSKF
ncbi:tape measure protein [Oceanobacillus sojae]|uniref:Tape measure protein N-terminal domain-containing protein n=1 Tax=Oceanobacillus sojae TaxID=582851 RepID=A0A511ZIJ9_9BACI|nr:tape measure protein [Oceanobacillus sojae]GEN87255.1 hypothetical protein OSO01_19940 [Oceanobacillus sojae]